MVCISKTRLFIVVAVVLGLSVIFLTGTGVSAAENVTGEVDDALYEETGETNIILDLPATPETMTQGDRKDVVSGLKRYSDTTQKPVKDRLKEMDGVKIQKSWWIKNAILVTADLDTVDPKELAGIEGVERVEPDRRVKVPEPVKTKSDVEPYQGDYTYGLEQINAPDVWDEMVVTGEGVRVVVSDTGVDADHPDIELTDDDGWIDCVEASRGSCVENNDPVDSDYHGTHVSGTVAGGDAGGTHIGVAPDVELAHARTLDDGGWRSDIIGSIQWAVDTESDIISMSLGGSKTGSYIEPVTNAMEADTLVVASIGNDREGTSGSPGAVWDSMSSGATDENKDVAWFSGGELIDASSVWGNDAKAYWPDEYITPDIAAPGSDVLSAEPGGGYQVLSGTSMSAPHKTGTAALIISAAESEGKELSPYEVRDLMMETAWKPDDWDESMAEDAIGDKDTRYGRGIIDVESAVQEVIDSSANFEVDINTTNSPIIEGEVLTVDATVTNTGGATATQTVTAEVPGVGSDSSSVSLGEMSSTTETFEIQTEDGDAGDYTVTVSSENDSVSEDTRVVPPEDILASVESGSVNIGGNGGTGESAITLDSENGMSIANVEVSVDTSVAEIVDVEPGADVDTSSNAVNYDVIDETADSVRIEYANIQAQANPVEDFELARIEFEAQTDDGSAQIGVAEDGIFDGNQGEYNLVGVEEGILTAGAVTPLFKADVADAKPVVEGNTMIVKVSIANTGGQGDTQTVTAEVPGVGSDSSSVSLDEMSSTTETFEIQTEDGDAGDYNLTVSTQNDSVSAGVEIVPPEGVRATVKSNSVDIKDEGERGESTITLDAEDGMSIANVEVSVDTSVAEIVNVQEGADVESSQPTQTFDVVDQTADSVRIEYNNIQAQANPVQDFELAVVEFESQTGDGSAQIGVSQDGLFDGNQEEYIVAEKLRGILSIGTLFTEPLHGFNTPPTNTEELDPTLYEDISGDGDGTDPSQTVNLWTELVVNPQNFDDLTQEQVDALDWNGDGQLTPADAVSLWTEQVLA